MGSTEAAGNRVKELTRPQPHTSTRAPTCGVPAASGEGRVKPLEFLHAEVGGGQVRAGLVRFLSPCTLGGWARSLTSLGRLGLALWNHQEPQAICPGLCVPCLLNQAVFQCQPHLSSRISPPNSERVRLPRPISLQFRQLTAPQKQGDTDTGVSAVLLCVRESS